MLNGKYPKSITGYIQSLKLRFENKDAKDEAYAALEKVRYDGNIRYMFTQIQMHNNKALVSEAVLKKIILDWFPHKILEQIHTVNLTGKTDNETITIIMNAGRTEEKWDEGKKNLGLRKSIPDVRREVQRKTQFEKKNWFDKPKIFKRRFQGCQDNKNQSD